MSPKKPKVALCFPNFSWQSHNKYVTWNMVPHTLLLLAATIRDFCDVSIIDANYHRMTPDEYKQKIREGNYDFVAVSILVDSFSQSGHLALSLAKSVNPDIITAMGGVHATIYPELVIEDPAIDYACMGEGEELLGQLLRFLFLGGPMPRKGLAYREGGEIVIQSRADHIVDLDSLPMPAFDLVDFNLYTNWWDRFAITRPSLLPYVNLGGSRGCPGHCNFCQVGTISGHTLRLRSAQKVLDELSFYKERYNIRSFVSIDDNLLHYQDHAMELFQGIIDRGLVMPWKAINVAVFKLNRELLELMRKSGCEMIGLAIESGSPRVLKEIIHKPIQLDHTKEMVAIAHSLGIYISSNFIIGLPGETWDEIRQTMRYAEAVDVDYIRISLAVPLRHTELWEQCLKNNAFPPGFEPTNIKLGTGQICSPEFDPRELTILRAYEWDRINFSSPEKIKKTADMLQISVDELNVVRRETRDNLLAML